MAVKGKQIRGMNRKTFIVRKKIIIAAKTNFFLGKKKKTFAKLYIGLLPVLTASPWKTSNLIIDRYKSLVRPNVDSCGQAVNLTLENTY